LATPVQKDFPSSAEVGILLHEIFEKDAFSKEALQNILWGTVLQDYLFEIQTLVDSTLNCKLEGLYQTIILKEIDPNKRVKEVEFLIDSKETGSFLTGFIDQIFQHNGLYYIIDWKSNALNDYSIESLNQEMHNQSYILQESIYREALMKYLKNLDKRPFSECFGGSFYIFLRGIKSGGGIWYKP
jgi:exodeoxyribonuclease V beta subunit